MPFGQRGMVDQVSEAVQVLSRLGAQAHQALLPVQGEARVFVRRFEAEQREEHLRAQYPDCAA